MVGNGGVRVVSMVSFLVSIQWLQFGFNSMVSIRWFQFSGFNGFNGFGSMVSIQWFQFDGFSSVIAIVSVLWRCVFKSVPGSEWCYAVIALMRRCYVAVY